jgi:L-ascorbate metabolism protein UlaG (beta-lactamase superfamily)
MGLGNGVKLTWFGHATFVLESPNGKRILVDPFFEGNPKAPAGADPGHVDLVLLTHAHGDHVGDAARFGRDVPVVAIVELAGLLSGQGVQEAVGINKGGSYSLDGITVTMVHALHSSGFQQGDQTIYAGEAAGFVVRLENGFTVYFAGDTNAFMDMQLIGRLHEPDLAVLPIGDWYTMGPREAAEAIRLLGVKRVVPSHYGTFPVLTGTPDQLRSEASDVEGLEVVALEPGETLD